MFSLAATSTQAAPVGQPWHLDRINQRTLPLDGNTSMGSLTGQGVTIYVVDSGVNFAHEQFGGRATAGIDPLSLDKRVPLIPSASDCNGHGTHVSALAAGSTVGVARDALVISVRILDCNGEGSVDDVVRALKWVRGHHVGGTPAIVNLSLGVDLGDDALDLEAQVKALIAEGVVVTISAGNGDATYRINSCDLSPAHVPDALTVGAVAVNDAFTSYSGFGPCVDLLAPGGTSTTGIESASIEGNTAYQLDAGTSMASPLVAGFVALLLQQQPGLCPAHVSDAVIGRATPNVVTALDVSTPNRLLFVDTSVVAPGVPGVPSHVVASTGKNSLGVSWERPCDGGSPITGYRVALVRNGKVAKRLNVGPNATSAQFKNLVAGHKYSVVVKAINALGEGGSTSRYAAPAVATLRAGRTVATSSVVRFGGDLTLQWSVASKSSRICRVSADSSRITFLRKGTCQVALRTQGHVAGVVRNLTIS